MSGKARVSSYTPPAAISEVRNVCVCAPLLRWQREIGGTYSQLGVSLHKQENMKGGCATFSIAHNALQQGRGSQSSIETE